METRSLLGGMFLAWGISSVLSIFEIPFDFSMRIMLGSFTVNVASVVIAVLCLVLAFYLIRAR